MQPRLSRILMIVALGMASLHVSAQQSIIVSRPGDSKADGKSDGKSNTSSNSSLLDDLTKENRDNSERAINAGDYDAPRQFFRDYSPTLPAPRPVFIDRNASEAANKNRNWTLLTPEEILGVKTPEDILGIKKNKDQDLSLDQQFLQRLRSGPGGGATNGSASAINWRKDDRNDPFDNSRSSAWDNAFDNSPFRRLTSDDNPVLSSGQSASPQQANQIASLSQLFNPAGTASDSQQASSSIWSSPFAKPAVPSTRTAQDQLDAMERFRALMQPSSAATKIATETRYSRYPTPSSKSEPASFFQSQSQFNPNPNPPDDSVDKLFNTAARPTGVQSVTGFNSPKQNTETARPSWQAQYPPWMRTGPQSH